MNERTLLTEQQISRRKTAAIWLIGVGLFLFAISSIARVFARSEILYYLFEKTNYIGEKMDLCNAIERILPVVSIWIINPLLILGLFILKSHPRRDAAFLIKHWLTALIGFTILQGLIIPLASQLGGNIMQEQFFGAVVLPIIPVAINVTCILYMFWAISVVLRNSSNKIVIKKARLIGTALLLLALVLCVDESLMFRNRITFFRHYNGYNHILHGYSTALSFLQAVTMIWRDGLICYTSVLFGLMLWGIKGLIRSELFDGFIRDTETPEKHIKFPSFMIVAMALLALGSYLSYHIANWRTYDMSSGNDAVGFFVMASWLFALILLFFYRRLDRKLFGEENAFGYGQLILSYAIPWIYMGAFANLSGSSNDLYYFGSALPIAYLLLYMIIVLYTFYESFVRINDIGKSLMKFIFLSICSGFSMVIFLL